MAKPFKTIEEQITILKNRALIIDNELEAKRALMTYGYYEIINGYKMFLLDSNSQEEQFSNGETFSHLLALFELDKSIRNEVMQATLEIELSLRTAIAYTIAESFGEKEKDYLKPSNYRRGKKRKNSNRYPLYQLLDKLNRILTDDVEPYKHYRTHHGNIPPWILLKGTTLGNLINFYKLLKPTEKNKVISYCLGLDPDLVSEPIKILFAQGLDLILRYRNRAAHSGRMFNYQSDKTIDYSDFLHSTMEISYEDYKTGQGATGLLTLQYLLRLFENRRASLELEFMYYHIGKHIEKYPDDLKLLISEMKISQNQFEIFFSKYK